VSLQGVLEMAGAVCHEQNQPLMAINGYCTLAQMNLDPDHPAYSSINNIQKAAERISVMSNKLMNITRYKTCEYVDGTQIIDIDQSAAPPDISQSIVQR
jgi:C4-dicarboxylate-specific signal transduction histidine kinase